MIKKVHITGFKSLKEVVDLEMRPLNVLIGPNNGGKTNFLDFFETLSEAMYEELGNAIARRGGFDSILYAGYADDKERKISWEIGFGSRAGEIETLYKVELNPDKAYKTRVAVEQLDGKNLRTKVIKKVKAQKSRTGLLGSLGEVSLGEVLGAVDEEVELPHDGELAIAQIPQERIEYVLRAYIKSWVLYEFSTTADSPLRREQSLKAGVQVSPSGDNLAAVLLNMKERVEYRDAYNEIIKTLRVAFPTFKELHFPCEVSEGKIALRWEEGFRRDFSVSALSDGVLKFLCLATLLLSPNLPPLICIDEPEIGLHPKSVALVGELLTAAAQRTQLIVATHSPQVIRQLKPEDILIVEKKDGATELRHLPLEELQSWLKDFTLEELWLTGVIGGR